MSRTALACCTALALVWAAPATAQSSLLERLARESKPLSDQIIAVQDPNRAHGLPPIGRFGGMTILPTTPIKTVVEYDPGGWIKEHDDRWRLIAAQGGPVDILGMCQSACTLALAHVRKDRLCFGENAYLNFHMPRLNHDGGPPALEHAKWMFDIYPGDIRGWLIAKGGLEKMPLQGYWKLPASDLWQMGYRRCS